MQVGVFSFLWKYLSKLKLLFFSVILLISLSEIATRIALYYGSEIIRILGSDASKEIILKQSLCAAGLAAVFFFSKDLLRNFMIMAESVFLPRYLARVAKDLFASAHNHSTAFFVEELAGNISGKIKTVIDRSYAIYYQLIVGSISPLIALLTTFVFIAYINLELAFIMLFLNIILIFVMWKLSLRLAPYTEKSANAMSASTGILVDSISNALLVKNFSNYTYEKKNYFRSIRKTVNAYRSETSHFGLFFIWQGALRSAIQALFFALPLWYWYQNEVTLSQYVLIQTLILTLNNIYHNISLNFLQFFKNYGGIKDGLKLLNSPCDVVDKPKATDLHITSTDITFDHISYCYRGKRNLFKDFYLHIPSGHKIGLVGRSGSGKSTLLKLLSRYYDLNEGQILINNIDISTVKQDSLRQHISLIPQDVSLFNRSIMENIRYGNINCSDEEVINAAKQAYCHEFIMRLPDGYNSKVGERGVMLSGGERQRIAIARAILKNAPILILDEATSALDSESERYIQEALRKIMVGKTVIAVAHRLSTLKEMDNIVVLDNGKIIEQGSHQSLIRAHGLYNSFSALQIDGFLSSHGN